MSTWDNVRKVDGKPVNNLLQGSSPQYAPLPPSAYGLYKTPEQQRLDYLEKRVTELESGARPDGTGSTTTGLALEAARNRILELCSKVMGLERDLASHKEYTRNALRAADEAKADLERAKRTVVQYRTMNETQSETIRTLQQQVSLEEQFGNSARTLVARLRQKVERLEAANAPEAGRRPTKARSGKDDAVLDALVQSTVAENGYLKNANAELTEDLVKAVRLRKQYSAQMQHTARANHRKREELKRLQAQRDELKEDLVGAVTLLKEFKRWYEGRGDLQALRVKIREYLDELESTKVPKDTQRTPGVFRPGDRVKPTAGIYATPGGGYSFSNGREVATVDRVEEGDKVWLKETSTWIYAKYITRA